MSIINESELILMLSKIKINFKILNCILNIVIFVLVVCIFIIFFDKENKDYEFKMEEDDYIQTISTVVYDEQVLDGLKFTSSPVVSDVNEEYRIEVRVSNISEDNIKFSGFTLIIYDENMKKVDTLSYFEYMELNSNDSVLYFLNCDKDLLKDNYVIEYKPSYMISE